MLSGHQPLLVIFLAGFHYLCSLQYLAKSGCISYQDTFYHLKKKNNNLSEMVIMIKSYLDFVSVSQQNTKTKMTSF